MKDDRLSLLGMAARARVVTSGSDLTERAVRSGEARFVILSEDASQGIRKRIQDKCNYYHVPCVTAGTKEDLGHRIGKEARSCVAVLDEGFAREFRKRFGIETL